jgi:DNA invertase Pin-like site-specific DNA recombinase
VPEGSPFRGPHSLGCLDASMHESQNFRTSQLTLESLAFYCAKVMHESGTTMTIFGYARVSTDGQTLAAQEAQLKASGCARVFSETASGAKTDRAILAKVLTRLEPDDILLVTRLDRLARSTRDLLNILATIADKKAGFRSLAEPMIDTTSSHGRLVTGILAIIGEFERDLIRSRTSEGRKRATAAGVHMGRPSKLNRHQQKEAIARRENGETLTDIARTFGVSHTTIGRLMAP